jgi:hypothetical protein
MSKQTSRIVTDGYRGPGTHNVYLEPGEYAIGEALDLVAHVVPRELADYLVSIDKAIPTAFVEDAPPVEPDGGDAGAPEDGEQEPSAPAEDAPPAVEVNEDAPPSRRSRK